MNREPVQIESDYFDLLENADDIVQSVSPDGRFLYVNRAWRETLGYTLEESAQLSLFDIIHPDSQPHCIVMFERVIAGESVNGIEATFAAKDGRRISVEGSANCRFKDGRPVATRAIFRNITERKYTETELRSNEEKYRSLVENLGDIVYTVDINGTATYISPVVESILGYHPSEITGRAFADFIYQEDLVLCLEHFQRCLSGQVTIGEYRLLNKIGQVRWVRSSNKPVLDGDNVIGTTGVLSDITDRKHAEAKHQIIIETALDGFLLSNLEGEFLEVNDSYCSMIGYTRAELLNMSISDIEAVETPEMIAHRIRKITEQGSDRFETRHRCKDGTIIDVEVSVNHHDAGEGQHFVFIRNITERKRVEEELKQSLEKLLKASQATIQAMAATIESKDPYTAGHQCRVAELSRAIAQDMGFQDDEVEGVYRAAIIHDIGKIYIPVEILSKPSQLTNIELNLIKMHPQAGYDILKSIDFPWPIADIVLGHHERLDGSGYPRGLCADEISMESRILSVADVVEAITSHRPYRPAIGIEKALNEISRYSGILYDQTVVEACLNLFKENRFRFNDEIIGTTSLSDL